MSDVSTPLAAYNAMTDDWDLVDALLGGTVAMRDAGATYMPRFPLECEASYKERLATATLFPAFSETVSNLSGHVFARPVVVGDDVPAAIQEQAMNIDLQGSNLTVFAATWFYRALAYGMAHVLVDYPRVQGARTAAAEKALGARPYCTVYAASQLIGWRFGKIDGVPKLTLARLVESVEEDDGEFGTKLVKQIRVLRRGSYQVWRCSGKDGAWFVHDEGPMSVAEIPLVTLYTGRTGLLTAKPPLREVAHLNVKHWQEQSDQDTSVRFARVRLLWTAGADVETGPDGKPKPLQASADSVIGLPTGAQMGVVQGSAESVKVGRDSLDALERQMSEAGAKLRRKDAQFTKTVQQAADDSVTEKSALGKMAQGLEDAIDQVLQFMADWQKLGDGGSVEINKDFDLDSTPDQSMATLITMNGAGNLSDQTLFEEAKRRSLVADGVNWETEQERLRSQPRL